jgi:membrane-bound serine protease (ClpP class)
MAVTLVALVVSAIAASASSAAAAQGQSNAVWLIPIDREITAATTSFVRSRIQRANDEGVLGVVLFLDTPGGSVDAMQDIVGIILHETRVPSMAVVQNAFSAGALIAMSAERLAMLPGSSIGAALPILSTPTGIAPVDEKFSSALRGEFRSVAEARGRNALVAEGMVDERIEIPGLSTATELVTLTAAQAVTHGIADIQAGTLQDALEQFGYAGVAVTRLEPSLTERLGGFLAQPLIAAALLVIGIGGLLIEIFSPGFGIPGAIGILALAAFAAAAFVATPAGPFDILLLVVGVVLLAVEVLVLPGFGVAGVLGLAAMIVGVVRIFEDQSLPVLGYSALFGGVLLALLLWMLPNSRLASAFRLSTRLTTPSGPLTVATAADHVGLAGAVGTALSDLRPAGVARFGGERIDVVSEGEFVSAGSTIRVLRTEGNRVTVRQVTHESDARTVEGGADGAASASGGAGSTDTGTSSHTAADLGREET